MPTTKTTNEAAELIEQLRSVVRIAQRLIERAEQVLQPDLDSPEDRRELVKRILAEQAPKPLSTIEILHRLHAIRPIRKTSYEALYGVLRRSENDFRLVQRGLWVLVGAACVGAGTISDPPSPGGTALQFEMRTAKDESPVRQEAQMPRD